MFYLLLFIALIAAGLIIKLAVGVVRILLIVVLLVILGGLIVGTGGDATVMTESVSEL